MGVPRLPALSTAYCRQSAPSMASAILELHDADYICKAAVRNGVSCTHEEVELLDPLSRPRRPVLLECHLESDGQNHDHIIDNATGAAGGDRDQAVLDRIFIRFQGLRDRPDLIRLEDEALDRTRGGGSLQTRQIRRDEVISKNDCLRDLPYRAGIAVPVILFQKILDEHEVELLGQVPGVGDQLLGGDSTPLEVVGRG